MTKKEKISEEVEEMAKSINQSLKELADETCEEEDREEERKKKDEDDEMELIKKMRRYLAKHGADKKSASEITMED